MLEAERRTRELFRETDSRNVLRRSTKLTGKVRERREVRAVDRGDGQKEVGDQDSMPTQS